VYCQGYFIRVFVAGWLGDLAFDIIQYAWHGW